MDKHTQAIVEAAQSQYIGEIDYATISYVTRGGTYVIASAPNWNDSGEARDLVAILPMALEGTRVIPLYVAVNPDLIDALRAALDA